MNNRILMVVMTAAVVSTTTGCSPFRNFFFGRGAQCGLCNRATPSTQQPQTPKCGLKGCFQPRYSAPAQDNRCGPEPCQAPQTCQPAQPCGPCGNAGVYGPTGNGQVISGYSNDPYTSEVIGNGVMYDSSGSYSGDGFVPAQVDNQGYRMNYPSAYDPGYKVDKDGLRIIHEDPMPPNAQVIN